MPPSHYRIPKTICVPLNEQTNVCGQKLGPSIRFLFLHVLLHSFGFMCVCVVIRYVVCRIRTELYLEEQEELERQKERVRLGSQYVTLS